MPYRHDRAPLEARRAELLKHLEDATRKAAELDVVTQEQARLRVELADVEERLRRARGFALPVLDSLQVASPCSADWAGMKGDDQVRFCGSCEKNVYNLSAMPRAEAEALLVEREGNVCVRFYRRADGTVISGDCPDGVKKKRRRRLVLAVASAGAFVAAGATTFVALYRPRVAGCSLDSEPLMGDLATATPVVMGSPPVAPMQVTAPVAPAQVTGAPEPPPAVMGAPPPRRQSPPVPTMGEPQPPTHTMGKPRRL